MKSPYTFRIDPDKARELAESGAVLLLLDVPHGTVVGIDQQVKTLCYIVRHLSHFNSAILYSGDLPSRLQAYVVGPDFKGVKMIPPGVHFVSSNAVSSSSRGATQGSPDVAPTVSTFVDVALRQVAIRRWSQQEELLLPLDDADEVRMNRQDDSLHKHQPVHNLSI